MLVQKSSKNCKYVQWHRIQKSIQQEIICLISFVLCFSHLLSARSKMLHQMVLLQPHLHIEIGEQICTFYSVKKVFFFGNGSFKIQMVLLELTSICVLFTVLGVSSKVHRVNRYQLVFCQAPTHIKYLNSRHQLYRNTIPISHYVKQVTKRFQAIAYSIGSLMHAKMSAKAFEQHLLKQKKMLYSQMGHMLIRSINSKKKRLKKPWCSSSAKMEFFVGITFV